MSYSATELRCYNNCYLNVVFTLTQGKPAIHVEDDSDDDSYDNDDDDDGDDDERHPSLPFICWYDTKACTRRS